MISGLPNEILANWKVVCDMPQVDRVPCRVDAIRLVLIDADELYILSLEDFRKNTTDSFPDEVIANVSAKSCYQSYAHII
jgi:hypothetical protein